MKYLAQHTKGVNYKERDRYNSTNPYSATKAGGEELVLPLKILMICQSILLIQ